MSISVRHYIFADDGSIRRVPRRILDALPFGTDAIPEFAGTRQRTAQVVIENEGGKPLQILDVVGCFWDFDADGKIDKGLHESMESLMRLARDGRSKRRSAAVVDIMPEIKRRDAYAKHRWKPTGDDINRIAADIWPGIDGGAAAIESVKGVVPKKPPLSRFAKEVVASITQDIAKIGSLLATLNGAELKGIAFEGRQLGAFPDDSPSIWKGVAEEAERLMAIAAAHRTGRGEWYAVIEAMRAEDARFMRSVATAHVKYASREEAIVEGRKLLAEKAAWLAEEVSLEINLYSALEWQPND